MEQQDKLLLYILLGITGMLGPYLILLVLYKIGCGIVNLFRRPARIAPVVLGPRCPACHTSMNPVTCMTCGPARVPDVLPVAWA